MKKMLHIILIIMLITVCILNVSGATQQNSTSSSTRTEIHFIDVGQGDCILIQTPGGKAMLIDAGNNSDSGDIVSYLVSNGVKKIDVLVATHPHEDHIGGMDMVINNFNIGKIYMPKVTTNTKTFQDILTAVKNKGLKITTATAGVSIDVDTALKTEILAPVSTRYSNLNDYSVVIRLQYNKTSFLFAGDASTISEQEMMNKGFNLKANVLKIGHHGSEYSTSSTFLNKVTPKYAVISVGKGNIYGHPAKVTLDKLAAKKMQVYRTDLSGTIVATSDGNTIKFDKSASAIKPQGPPAKVSSTVYITKSGTKYHADGCRYLGKSKIPINLADAVAKGFTPCSVCKPPVLNNNNQSDSNINTSSSSNTNTNTNTNTDSSSNADTEKKEVTVYITKTGSKYHSAGCSYLSRSCIPISLSDAKASYTPCSRCNPPQ